MIASVPIRRGRDGEWQGVNLTYDGFFSATAITFACDFNTFSITFPHIPVMRRGVLGAG
jgi:hypothetical protein